MALTDFGFSGAPQPTQQPQQPVSGDLLSAFGVQPEDQNNPLDPNILGSMTPAERALYLTSEGVKSGNITSIQEGFEATSADNEAFKNTLELKGIFNEFGIDPYNENPEVSSRANLEGAAGMDAILMGATSSEPNLIQSVASTLAGEGSNQAIVARRRAVARNYQEAYESLKGGGQITEYEGKTMANALNSLGDSSLTDENFRREAEKLYERFHRIQKLGENNIRVNAQTGEEYIFDPETRERTRVVSFFNSDTGELTYQPITGDEDVIEVPNYLSARDIALFKASIPVGQKFSFTDTNGETHVATKTREFNLPAE